MYSINDIFYTIQGEGFQSGRPAVFVRVAGCNLWSGREADRAKAACSFCDTDFSAKSTFESSVMLANAILDFWPDERERPFIVFTGGEPLLQLDPNLVYQLHLFDAIIAVETNGTIDNAVLPKRRGEDLRTVDWVCVSPKFGTELKVKSGDELKVVWPQLWDLDNLEKLRFSYRYLQPMDAGAETRSNIERTVAEVKRRPRWRISLQTHKMMGLA